jgi:hypothetical protein
MDDDFKRYIRLGRTAVVAYFKVVSRNFQGHTEEKNENPKP